MENLILHISLKKTYKTYSYELSDVYDRLELLFHSETINNPHYNISSIINYIYESWSLPMVMIII